MVHPEGVALKGISKDALFSRKFKHLFHAIHNMVLSSLIVRLGVRFPSPPLYMLKCPWVWSFCFLKKEHLKLELNYSTIPNAVIWVLASDDCPALLPPLETWNIQTKYTVHHPRPPRHLISCRDITDSHIKADLVGNGFLKVPLFYSCSKTKQGQSWECVECVCVIMPAAPTLPGHAGRHQGHKHTNTHKEQNTCSLWSSFNCWSYELFVNPIDLQLSSEKRSIHFYLFFSLVFFFFMATW